MKKIKISYSLLKLWTMGDIDGAVATYFHIDLDREKPPAVLKGIEIDKKVEMYVKKKKSLPKAFGGLKMHNPEPKKKIVVSYNEKADLVGEFDIYDEPIIYEIKSSKANEAGDFLNDFQLDIYFLIAKLAGLKVEKGIILCLNPETKKHTIAIAYFSQRRIRRAKNIIDSLLPELYDYFANLKYPFLLV